LSRSAAEIGSTSDTIEIGNVLFMIERIPPVA
jgi:hypothetical protein